MNGIETMLLICESQFNQTKEMDNFFDLDRYTTPVKSHIIERELNFDEPEINGVTVNIKTVDPGNLKSEDIYDFQHWLRRKSQIEKELADKEFIYLARCAKIEKELVLLERSFLEKKLELIHLKASHL